MRLTVQVERITDSELDMKPIIRILLFCILSIAFIGCDRVTKDLAKLHLRDHEPISMLHNTLTFVYVENTGAFLSFGDTWPRVTSLWILTVLPFIFLSCLFIMILRRSRFLSNLQMTCWTLIFSGGIGNIIDRLLFDRHVTDFMVVGYRHFTTGIFNVADLYVTVGAMLLLADEARRYFNTKKTNNTPLI